MSEPEKKIHWGLVCTARINETFLQTFRDSSRSKAWAVSSRDIQRAQSYAKTHQIPRAYATMEELLRDPEVDAVYVSLPNHLHAEACLKALEAGKHVLCEKPLAMSLSEILPAAKLAQSKKLLFIEAFMYRHHKQSLFLREFVASKKLGMLKLLEGSFQITLHDPQKAKIRLDPTLGGGALWDLGCYVVNCLLHVHSFKRPVRVTGLAQWEGGVDRNFAGTLEFEDGVLAHFDCGFEGFRSERLRVVGTEGELRVDKPFKPQRRELLALKTSSSEDRSIEIFDDQDAYARQTLSFENAFFNKENPFPPMKESLQTTLVLEKLLEAAKEKKVVSIEESEWSISF